MCSISGYYKLSEEAKVLENFFKDSFDLMRHRGPDFEKFIQINSKVSLGHQRLSIIDLHEESNQPFKDETNYISFNGEIFNYKELIKSNLIQYSFKTESDTEVLIKGLNTYGLDFLNKLNGMFAFAYYSNQTLYLVRDRFGLKPLYYSIINDVLYFSSEIKPLLKIQEKTILNKKAIKSYLKDTATDYDKETFFQNIFQVQKGTYLKLVNNKPIEIVKWYHNNDYQFDEEIFNNYNQTISYVEKLITDAIKIRLQSDVPLCMTISGGIDSSLIYTLIKDNLKKDIKLFTFSHNNVQTDELPKVLKLAKLYNDEVEIIKSNTSLNLKSIQSDIYVLESPIWGLHSGAYRDVYKKIKERGFKVVIEGHGGDEQLAGYDFMLEGNLVDNIIRFNYKESKEALNIIYNNKYFKSKNKLFFSILLILKISLKLFTKPFSNKRLSSIIKWTFDYKILPIVLRTFDRLPMKSSLESRSPYLDYRLVEFFTKMPNSFKVNNIGNKAILREILKKHGKDFIYLDQRKMGFSDDLSYLEKTKKIEKIKKDLNINYSIPIYKSFLNKIFGNNNLNHLQKVIQLKVTENHFSSNE